MFPSEVESMQHGSGFALPASRFTGDSFERELVSCGNLSF